MELVGVQVELPSNSPIVLLKEQDGAERLLPIFIGGAEATAIALALEEVETPRPMTHDLMKDLLDTLGVRLEKIVITDLRERTFFAELHLATDAGTRTISSRPSDAMALAVRTATPVFAEDRVIDEAGYLEDEDKDETADAEEVLDQFREFIDSVSPDDFES